ncbi:NAD(P)H-hydrate dehydratase [Streptococcus sp. DFI.7.26]|uniref:ADP-dependent (S)-NAD(P)H-hydrate dehydratase n=1 Tax=Streptococcus xiaochunlingii TaxID=2589788 RepID=A0ABY2YDR9_9STRE|nr:MULTISPECIES: NAD(P)H-hydrate dehydratase [Streptococcus]MCF4964440.1 NAD(P)H-hydrate dehydratase [Streptococcus sp. GS001]MCG5641246.1 NAD(P)H-hydrate dehydratase [Streptococcus sp. DFI.7.26]RSK01846.1 ADP-dependent (S)-NAD(P)H-hydrate dehydratase [Streptococcus sp. A12]TPE37479.1 NAD(P)H-hydrate dehydratase [Streptococcus xiaochunlingii]
MKEIDQALLKKVIIERPRSSHKGDYGRLLLIGGTYPYGGAIIMAALAAVHSGAGLVTVATDRENIPSLHSQLPEAMAFAVTDQELLAEQIAKVGVILLGPGLNANELGGHLVELVFERVQPHQVLILDGGAISLYTRLGLSLPPAQLVFTPHQKEWEAMSGLAIGDQGEEATRQSLSQLPPASILVQKGPQTKIWQQGQTDYYQLSVGGPYQATGGMGDTLAGMIAGFAGQFPQVGLYERVVVASHLHSGIADDLSKNAYVVLPTAISKEIPKWMREICLSNCQ